MCLSVCPSVTILVITLTLERLDLNKTQKLNVGRLGCKVKGSNSMSSEIEQEAQLSPRNRASVAYYTGG